MRIYRPQMPLHGAERENSFVAQDMAGVELGQAWLYVVIDKDGAPERPLRIHMNIDAHPSARDMLFGAALARARQIRRLRSGMPGRIIAQCHPNDIAMLTFYKQMGFDDQDGLELFRWQLLPEERPFFPPVGTQVSDTLLQTRADLDSLLMRVNQWGGRAHPSEWMLEAVEQPYFMVCGVYNGKDCLGECMVTGGEGEAALEMLYTIPAWRRHHIATALLLHTKDQLIRRGAGYLRVEARRSNFPAVALMQTQKFDWVGTMQVTPGLDI